VGFVVGKVVRVRLASLERLSADDEASTHERSDPHATRVAS
jgi:hypothetical protein